MQIKEETNTNIDVYIHDNVNVDRHIHDTMRLIYMYMYKAYLWCR